MVPGTMYNVRWVITHNWMVPGTRYDVVHIQHTSTQCREGWIYRYLVLYLLCMMLEFTFCSFVLLFFIGLANENKDLSQDRIVDDRFPIGPMLAQRNVFSTWACDHGVSFAYVGFCCTYIPIFSGRRKIVEVILQSPLSCATTYALFLPNNRISENRNVIEVIRIGPFQADSPSLIG